MLTAVPKRWLSWDFALHESTGAAVAELRLSSWRDRGSVIVGADVYRVYRQGLLGPFILEAPDASQAARAIKPSAFRREFTITHGERRYVLKAMSAFHRECGLFDETRRVGAIVPLSLLSRRAKAEFADEVPLSIQPFVVWLTLLLWKRDADAAATTAAVSS
jgi:hypothetical protein